MIDEKEADNINIFNNKNIDVRYIINTTSLILMSTKNEEEEAGDDNEVEKETVPTEATINDRTTQETENENEGEGEEERVEIDKIIEKLILFSMDAKSLYIEVDGVSAVELIAKLVRKLTGRCTSTRRS